MFILEGLSAVEITDFIFGDVECLSDEDEFEDEQLLPEDLNFRKFIAFSDWIPKKKQHKKLKKKDSFQCTICYDEIEDLVMMKDCEHKFCKGCLADYCNFKMGDAGQLYHDKVALFTLEKQGIFLLDILQTYGVKCPGLGCFHVMLPEEFSSFTNSSSMERFHRFSQLHAEALEKLKQDKQVPKKELVCPRCASTKLKKRSKGKNAMPKMSSSILFWMWFRS